MKTLLPFLLITMLVGCTTVPLDRQIYNADRGVTLVLQSTDAALLNHVITAAQAQSVSTITHQVTPLLDSAKAAVTVSDVAGATKTMKLVNALLAGLSAYVPGSTP